jgi:hypothetical protein
MDLPEDFERTLKFARDETADEKLDQLEALIKKKTTQRYGAIDARQDWPVREPYEPRGSRTDLYVGWRGLGRFWAIVIAVTGSAVAVLQTMGPPPEGTPDAIATKVPQDNPGASLTTSVVPSLNNLPSPAPLAAKQNADDPQNPPVPEPQHTTGVAADPSPTQAEAAISETGKPALRIYYSFESPLAAKNAQSLATRIGAELTRSDFKAESDLPKHAAIRISEERNHALARTIGQSLGDLGYEWEIENLSGLTQSRRNVIEVWLPAK